jgi:hypothetical protein
MSDATVSFDHLPRHRTIDPASQAEGPLDPAIESAAAIAYGPLAAALASEQDGVIATWLRHAKHGNRFRSTRRRSGSIPDIAA